MQLVRPRRDGRERGRKERRKKDEHLDKRVEPLDTLRGGRRVLLATVLVHLETDLVELLLDLLDDETVCEENANGQDTDELRDPDEPDPAAAPGGEEPDNSETGDDGRGVTVDGVGDGFERVLVDGRRERTEVDIGRLDGVRGGVVNGSTAVSAGDIGSGTGSVEVGGVDIFGIEQLRLLKVCEGKSRSVWPRVKVRREDEGVRRTAQRGKDECKGQKERKEKKNAPSRRASRTMTFLPVTGS